MDDENGEDIEKSENDKKEYRKIQLPNGLTALLISDGIPSSTDEASVSAAALCVAVGSFCEPDELPGLAHYVEHTSTKAKSQEPAYSQPLNQNKIDRQRSRSRESVVFLGSRKYPGVDSFDKFYKEHGGTSNAHTHAEHTVFYFDIERKALREALDRFAQFFVSPVLNVTALDRELNLVHAEWAMQAHNEKFRFEQLLNSFAKAGHPMGKFSWGNGESLRKIPDQKKIDVRLALENFRKTFYLAQHMALAVLSRDMLDDLQSMVEELFADIPYSDDKIPDFTLLGAPFDTPCFRKLYRIIPAKNTCQLQLTWALPSQLRNYRKKPVTYLSHLLGDEGEGSLLVLLRKRDWARYIRCGNTESSQEHNSTWSQFNVTISLTGAGLSHFLEVITMVFQYMQLIRSEGIKESIFQEIYDIDHNEFRYLESQEPQEIVHQMSVNMHRYDTADYITGGRVIQEFDAQLIRECLERLTPDRMNVALWSQTFQNLKSLNWQTERWFRTIYASEELRPDWIAMWSGVGNSPELHLPKPNIYIAKNFALKDPGCEIMNLETDISSSNISRLWYKPDSTFLEPKGYLNFCIRSMEAIHQSNNICLKDVYAVALRRLMSVYGYPAELAHLTYSILTFDQGLCLRFHGFDDKLQILFKTVVDCIAAFDMSEQVFTQVCNDVSEMYRAISLSPEKLNKDLSKALLQNKWHSVLSKRECLKDITLAQLKDYASRFYKGCFVETLVQGNITAEEARYLEAYLLEKLQVTATDDDERRLTEVLVTKVPRGCSNCTISNLNGNDENSVITLHYQSGQLDHRSQMLNELLIMNMEEPLFRQLRSQWHIGYDVSSVHRTMFGVTSFFITVCTQATRFTPDYIEYIVEHFLEIYNNECIQTMTEDTFDKFIDSVVQFKGYDDTNLKDEVNRHWNEVVGQTYQFKRREAEIRTLRTLTLTDWKDWSNAQLNPNPDRQKLIAQVIGHVRSPSGEVSPKNATKQQIAEVKRKNRPHQDIKDINVFKGNCETYSFTSQL